MTSKLNQFYMNTEMTNQTSSNILATYDETLTKPLLLNPSKYQSSINRFRLPLTGIPMTKNNIPFQQWAVSLAFQDSFDVWHYADEFVPQYNQTYSHLYNYYVYTLGTQCYVVQGTISGDSKIKVVNQYVTRPVTPGSTPLFAFNSSYLVLGFVGGYTFTLLDPNTLTVIQTVELSAGSQFALQLLTIDSSNNIYVVINNGSNAIETIALTPTSSWISGLVYQGAPMVPLSVCFVNGTLFVSDATYIYHWRGSAGGQPQGMFQYQRYQSPSAMTAVNGSVVVSYKLNSQVEDELYGLGSGGLFYDLYNKEQAYTPGQLTSQVAVSGPYLFSIGTTNTTFAINYPTTPSDAWFQVNTARAVKAIASPQSKYGVYAIDTENNLAVLNLRDTSNSWTTLSSQFAPAQSSSFVSFDFDADYIPYAVGSDGNLYSSSLPIYQRYYIMSESGNTSCLMGVSQTASGSFQSKTLKSGIPFEGQLVTQAGSPSSCYLAGNFYSMVQVPGSIKIGKYDMQFNLITTFDCPECDFVVWIKALAGYLLVRDGSGNVHIYDTTGTQQGSIPAPSDSVFQDVCCPDKSGKIVILLAQTPGAHLQYYVYDISTVALPKYVFTFAANGSDFSITANFATRDSQPGQMFSLDTMGTLGCYSFSDGTYENASFTGTPTTGKGYRSISFNETTLDLHAFSSSGVDIYTLDPSSFQFILFGTLPVSPTTGYVQMALETLHHGMIAWNKVGLSGSGKLQSIAVSRTTPGLFYAVDLSGAVQFGTRVGNQINFASLGFKNTYTQISVVGGVPPIPTGTPLYQLAVFDPSSLAFQRSFAVDTLPSFLSSDADGNIIAFSGTSSTTFNVLTGAVFSRQDLGFAIQGFGYSPLALSDAGTYDLWTYQDYLNQMNKALLTSFEALKLISGFASASSPYFVYDAGSKLFSIVTNGDYLGSLEEPAKYKILVNNLLWNMFLFPSSSSARTGFTPILVQNKVSNVVQSGTEQSVITSQEASTIAKFYDLVRILVQTKRLPVHGDAEAGINNSILLITDVVPDTSVISPAGLLIYQPTVLRWYPMYGQNPLTNIDVYFSYGTKDGRIYPIYLTPGEYASCKIQFQESE